MLWKAKTRKRSKHKVVSRASMLVLKGRLHKAMLEYNRLLEQDPGDIRILHKKADLLLRLGRTGPAVDAYARVAAGYSKRCFHYKAISIYKQILRIDSQRRDVRVGLAGEYEQVGLLREAMFCLRDVALGHGQEGNQRALRKIMLRICDLGEKLIKDPVKLGDLYLQCGLTAEAITQYQRAAEELGQQNQMERHNEALEKASRALALLQDPADQASNPSGHDPHPALEDCVPVLT